MLLDNCKQKSVHTPYGIILSGIELLTLSGITTIEFLFISFPGYVHIYPLEVRVKSSDWCQKQ